VTWTYKRELQTGHFGERITIADWHSPLFVCGWVIKTIGCEYIQIFKPSSKFLSIDFQERLIQPINKLKLVMQNDE